MSSDQLQNINRLKMVLINCIIVTSNTNAQKSLATHMPLQEKLFGTLVKAKTQINFTQRYSQIFIIRSNKK